MFDYQAYGLKICSCLPLPELQPVSEGVTDVFISQEKIDCRDMSDNVCGFSYKIEEHESILRWDNVGKFRISQGKNIFVEPKPDVQQDLIRLPLLGAVFAVMLQQRGLLVLHGSAVEIEGGAVVFLGQKGAGKSTILAALNARGNRLLSDDVAAIESKKGMPLSVQPGHRQIKLCPDSIEYALGLNPYEFPKIAGNLDKRSHMLDTIYCHEAIPLRGIFVLEFDDNVVMKRLGFQESMIQIIANTYTSRFVKSSINKGPTAGTHFRKSLELINTVPICSLFRPRSLKLLSESTRIIEEQISKAIFT